VTSLARGASGGRVGLVLGLGDIGGIADCGDDGEPWRRRW
jgi:hypothetical protein